jgi:hypothetical protein
MLIPSLRLSREDGIGKPCGMDLRERVVAAIEVGLSTRQAAARFAKCRERRRPQGRGRRALKRRTQNHVTTSDSAGRGRSSLGFDTVSVSISPASFASAFGFSLTASKISSAVS